jgi:hypothetical protein
MVEGIGLEVARDDGHNILSCYETLQNAVNRVRTTGAPFFLEFSTYRWREHCGHSFDNDIGYRTQEEFLEWQAKDPLNNLEKYIQESMVNMTNETMFRTLGRPPQPTYGSDNNLYLNDYSNYGDDKSNEEYYKRVMPGYSEQQKKQNPHNKPYYSHVNYHAPESADSVLLQKMNYMITLLEDQQDERTNNVTEEVILYSFLGIFIIFIADTFVKAGKYVR